MKPKCYLAIDVGAESGRVMAGLWNGRNIRLEEIYRFANGPVALGETIHIVGGGSQNMLLNQFAADACQRPVVAGPVEATAIGNLLTQVRASGELGSLAEMREVVSRSSVVRRYQPAPARAWNAAASRLAGLRERGHN